MHRIFVSLVLASFAADAAITGISPASGNVGAIINIAGDNFDPIASNNIVYFGAVRAGVAAATATNLAVVTPAGASYSPVTVTANGFTARSNQRFLPTFSADGSPVSASSFSPQQIINTDSGPIETVIADLDGDGKPDLVIANAYSHTVSILQNIGTIGRLNAQSFAPAVNLPITLGASSDNPIGIEAADLDGDGKLDILVCDRQANQIVVCRNLSTGGLLTTNSFAGPVNLACASDPRHVRVADIDGDGLPDILAACYGANTVSVFRNVGSPGNLSVNSFSRVDLPVSASLYDIAIADLDGDGKPDLAMANPGASYISLLRNVGSPGAIDTNSFEAEVQVPCLNSCQSIIAADIDGDGPVDLIVGSIQGNAMSVLRNLSVPGSLAFAAHVDFGAPGWVHNVSAADFNGDGKPDIAIDGELNSYMAIFQNGTVAGDFTAQSLSNRVDYATGFNAWGISVGDLDGDGRPDIVFCNAYDNTISLYRNISPVIGGPHHFQWDTISSPHATNVPFSVRIVARDAANNVFTNFNGIVLLGSTNGTAVTPAVSGNLNQGVWTGTITIAQPVTNLVLNADDGFGHIGLANPIDVIAPPILSISRSGGFLLIYWPSSAHRFVLESTPSLTSPRWTQVPGSPAQIGDQYLASIQIPATIQFYRLRSAGP